ncbi:uncharacterized protein ACOB8E_018966 isoform 1-T1 [Sarcophilus harrisii]
MAAYDDGTAEVTARGAASSISVSSSPCHSHSYTCKNYSRQSHSYQSSRCCRSRQLWATAASTAAAAAWAVSRETAYTSWYSNDGHSCHSLHSTTAHGVSTKASSEVRGLRISE